MKGDADFSIEQPQRVSFFFGTMTNSGYFTEHSFIEPSPKAVSKIWNISYSLDMPTWIAFFATFIGVTLVLYWSSRLAWSKEDVITKMYYELLPI